jgi:Flp pilus assembly pilin Flp
MERNMMKRIGRNLRALHEDTGGAMSVEKVMIIALISLPIVIALWLFRQTLVKWFSDQSDQLKP